MDAVKSLSAMITPEELAELIAGQAEIDVDDWQEHTEYSGVDFNKDTDVVRWFWVRPLPPPEASCSSRGGGGAAAAAAAAATAATP